MSMAVPSGRVVRALAPVVVLASLASMAGCGGDNRPPVQPTVQHSAERSRHLLQLAASEAVNIPDVDTRLTRLLNLADQQIYHDWQADAVVTLGSAMKTLRGEDARKLSEHARISGWVSTSQLARRCADMGRAQEACDGAIKTLRAIEDPGRRCEYVVGVCNEAYRLKSPDAATKLLEEAGPWTRSIDDIPRRRAAVTAFASALFNFDNYAAGQKVMQYEEDAAWRSATLTQLAGMAGSDKAAPSMAGLDVRSGAPASQMPAESVQFGKTLDYERVFQGQINSQTVRESREK